MVPCRGRLGGSSPQEDKVDGPGHDSTMNRCNVRLPLESGSALIGRNRICGYTELRGPQRVDLTTN